MTWRETTYKRDTLYEEVWSEPMTTVALRYGVSSVALAKMCRRLNVPMPGRGYWAKKVAGHEVSRRPLPPLKSGQSTEHMVTRWVDPLTAPVVDGGEHRRLLAQERVNSKPVVAETLIDPHPLITASMKVLRSFDAARSAPARQTDRCLAISVGPPLLERALRVMDALLKAYEARGHRVDIRVMKDTSHGRGPKYVTGVQIGEAFVEFDLTEDLSPVPPPPPTQQQLERAETLKAIGWHPTLRITHPRTPKEFEPNGNLRLTITNSPEYCGRFEWRDTKTRPLEAQLASFIGGTVVTAEAMRRRRAEEERARAEAQRAKDEQRQREQEKRLVKDLKLRIALWHEADATLQLAAAVEADVAKLGAGSDVPSRLQWVRWARERAARQRRIALEVPTAASQPDID
jgi:hypothetical protein